MSSRWSPGQPSVFRSRWGITKAISESGIDSLVRLVGRRGLRCARDVFAVPTSPPAGVLPVGARASKPAPRRAVMTDRSERIARTTNPPLLRLTHRSRRPTALRLTSTTDAALRTCASASLPSCGPVFDLGTQPELHAARAQVEHRLRHVGVSLPILGDCVAVSEAKDFGNALCVKEILGVHRRGDAG